MRARVLAVAVGIMALAGGAVGIMALAGGAVGIMALARQGTSGQRGDGEGS